jgi:hypothetical protein
LLQAAACNLALLLRKMTGAGTPRALHDVVAHLFFILLQPPLGYQRNPRAFAFVVGLHVAPRTASGSMFSTENSMPEIADLGTAC